MARWKQTVTCRACGHSAWRELEHDLFAGEPPVNGRFICSRCGARDFTVAHERMLPRWSDAFRPGGMRFGAITFAESVKHKPESQEQ